MRTEDLISLLSTAQAPVDLREAALRYGLALGWAAFLSTLLMAVFLGVRPDLKLAVSNPMFWTKFGMSAVIMAGALLACLRLARPGTPIGYSTWIIVAPISIIWVIAATVILNAEPAQRIALLLGQTWSRCPLLIAGLSVPGMFAFMWAMKGLAPTRPRSAGAATGLLAGALGATVYCLHCPESAAPFIAVWYLTGTLIPTLIGYLIGKRLLRW